MVYKQNHLDPKAKSQNNGKESGLAVVSYIKLIYLDYNLLATFFSIFKGCLLLTAVMCVSQFVLEPFLILNFC